MSTTTGFVPRWGKHSTNNNSNNGGVTSTVSTTRPSPLAQDVVPHVPYINKTKSMKSPTPGMYNQPRSHLQPLMKPVNSPGSMQTKSKRDENWERKRQDFLIRTGRSPPTTGRNQNVANILDSRNDTAIQQTNNLASTTKPDFEAAVQALVQKQNQKLVEELHTIKEEGAPSINSTTLQNKAPSPSEPRYKENVNSMKQQAIPMMHSFKENSYGANNKTGNILSPPQSRLGSRLSSMHLDMDKRALERRKKAEYRHDLEQQMKLRSTPSKMDGRRNNSQGNHNIPYGENNFFAPSPQTANMNQSPPVPPQYTTSNHNNSKADLQLRYKQELDKQIALKNSERDRNLKHAANPSSLNTIAFPSNTSPRDATNNSNSHLLNKADRMRQYKMELDQQIKFKKQQEEDMVRGDNKSIVGNRSNTTTFSNDIHANPAYLQQKQYDRRHEMQRNSYRQDLDNQMASRQRQQQQQQQQQRRDMYHNNGDDVFSKLGSHEVHAPVSRPFGAGGIKTLHNDRREVEKNIRLQARKSKYMEDLNRQIETRNQIRRMDDGPITQKPMISPHRRQQAVSSTTEGVYNNNNRNDITQKYNLPLNRQNNSYSSMNGNGNPYLEQMKMMDSHRNLSQQQQQQPPMFNPVKPTIHMEHDMNFSGYGAKQNLVDVHYAQLKMEKEQILQRQTELARKKDYGQELKQQMREKKAREDLSKSKRLEEEVKLMAKLKQINTGGRVAAVLGSNAGSGGGGGEPVRDEQVVQQQQQRQPGNAFGVPANRSVSFNQSDLNANHDSLIGKPIERQYSAQAALNHPPSSGVPQQQMQLSAAPKGYFRQRSGELHPGVEDFQGVQRKQRQQHQFRATLKEQVDEIKKRKAEEKKKEKEAEEREALRIQRELDEMNRKYRQEKDRPVETSPRGELTSNGPVAFSPQHKPQQQPPVFSHSVATSQNVRELHLSANDAVVDNQTNANNISATDDNPAAIAFRLEMEERQRQLQEELQQQKNLVFEMQQKMQLAMASAQQKQQQSYKHDSMVENKNVTGTRRQWKSPVNSVLPTHSVQRSTESLSMPLDDINYNNNYSMTPTPSKTRLSTSSSNRKSQSGLHRSGSSRRLKTPVVVPDDAFVSRPKLINSLDISSISEMLTHDQSFHGNSSLETSISGHSKLVQAFVEAGDPLDKTWLMPQASPSPMRNSKVRNSFTRNRNSLVEQSLQSSSHFVPFDGEHEEINGTNATIGNVANTVIDPDEQLLTSFTNKVVPSLAAVREESSSPTASDSNKTPKVVKTVVEKEVEENDAESNIIQSSTKKNNKPSPAMKTIANFLEVDPMLSPSVHDNSDISHIPTPQTPPRESLNNKPVNENTMFQVNTPSREEWQEMLNSSQLSNTNGVLPSGNNDDVKKTNTDGDVVKEEIYEDESSLNLSRLSDYTDLNNTQIENVLNSTNLSEVEEEALI